MTPEGSGIRDTSATDTVVDPSPLRRRRLIWAGAIVGLLLLGLATALPSVTRWSDSDRSLSRERLRFATVERGRFVRDITAQGRIVAAVAPTLYAPDAGTVTLAVRAGAEVEPGQLLATLANPELESQLEQERSTLESLEIEVERQRIETRQQQLAAQQTIDLAEVRIRAAERELARAEASYEHQVISLQDYEKAKDDLATARLEHQHAIADAKLEKEALGFEQRTRELQLERQRLLVTELERRMEALSVRSPVSGIVGNLAVEQKESVAANQALLTVVDLSAFEVEIQVPETYADDLGIGMETEISLGGRAFQGTLSSVSPEVQDSQVRARMRFDGMLPPGLRQNQRVTARIVLDSRDDVLTVQRGPFFDSGAGRVAYVVDDRIAVRRPISTGATSLGEIEIVDGLEEGETIVISSVEPFQGAERVLLTE